MGKQFLDQYSLLHYSTGVAAYYWGVPFWTWVVIHVGFEVAENTKSGMRFINTSLTFWPGGKPKQDTLLNVAGDNLSAILGWYCAKLLDEYGKEHEWY